MEIQYVGWATFRLTTDKRTKIVIDPFLEGKPKSGIPKSPFVMADFADTDAVLVSHAAGDHYSQAVEMMNATKATMFCGRDVQLKVEGAGIASERVWPMAPGNRWRFRDIDVLAFEACHHSISKFEGQWLTGVPLCYILVLDSGERIFFGGDNALGPHFKFFGEVYQPDLAILGIGGTHFRGQIRSEMKPDEAAIAAQWLEAKTVIPIHYLEDEDKRFQDELAKRKADIQVVIMKAGQTIRFTKAQGVRKP
jgi:L-ascorbate metabolism protein UlaG (beta-lactamase superfamily)